MDSRTRAFVKIQEGCNCFCSYCIIPFARGPVRSRELNDILTEVKTLVDSGYKEVVLTGINTALYGFETGELKLSELVKAVNDIDGDFRIRIGSLEPNVIGIAHLKNLLKYNKLCHHMHLSLQSGSDSILKAMNRNYDSSTFKTLIKSLREFDDLYSITTDIIVGFPGETEADFEDSQNIVRDSQFGKVHVFKYSKREMTKASTMENQISSAIKTDRSNSLTDLAEKASLEFLEKNIGSTTKVLIEEINLQEKQIIGYSDNYIRVYIDSNDNDLSKSINEFKRVYLIEKYRDGLKGKIVF
jgi:threonylcarbamoyladenosine tRNA methylthiotransferase MtaB